MSAESFLSTQVVEALQPLYEHVTFMDLGFRSGDAGLQVVENEWAFMRSTKGPIKLGRELIDRAGNLETDDQMHAKTQLIALGYHYESLRVAHVGQVLALIGATSWNEHTGPQHDAAIHYGTSLAIRAARTQTKYLSAATRMYDQTIQTPSVELPAAIDFVDGVVGSCISSGPPLKLSPYEMKRLHSIELHGDEHAPRNEAQNRRDHMRLRLQIAKDATKVLCVTRAQHGVPYMDTSVRLLRSLDLFNGPVASYSESMMRDVSYTAIRMKHLSDWAAQYSEDVQADHRYRLLKYIVEDIGRPVDPYTQMKAFKTHLTFLTRRFSGNTTS